MKKHLKLILTFCLAFCMILCLGLAVACDNTPQESTLTVTVVKDDGTPVNNQPVNFCKGGANGACTPVRTNADGVASIDLNSDDWKSETEAHLAVINPEEGYSVYGEDGQLYTGTDGPTVNVKNVKKYTFTLVKHTDITAGVANNVSGFTNKTVKGFHTTVNKDATLVINADVKGGEFKFSALVDNNATPYAQTLTASDSSFTFTPESTSMGRTSDILLSVTALNSNSAQVVFTLSQVYELNSIISVTNIDLDGSDEFEAYVSLSKDSTALSFSALGGDLSSCIGGFPVTVKVGNGAPVIWESVSDIQNITVNEKGNVYILFTFDAPDTAFLGLTVTDADNSSGGGESDGTIDAPYVAKSGVAFTADASEAHGYEYVVTITATGTQSLTIETKCSTAKVTTITIVKANNDFAYGKEIEAESTGINAVVTDNADNIIVLHSGDTVTITFTTYDPTHQTAFPDGAEYEVTLTLTATSEPSTPTTPPEGNLLRKTMTIANLKPNQIKTTAEIGGCFLLKSRRISAAFNL